MASNENENDAPQVYLLGKTYLANNQAQFYIRNDPIKHMSAGDRHSIIVTESGRAFAFGDNSSGQLGLGHTNNVEKVSCIKSLKFADGEKVILSACGRESSLVATNRGSIYGFGSNLRCQLGFESTESAATHSKPIKIEGFRGKINWKQISMGAEHACALTDDGQVYIWGANDDGQCGQPQKQDTIKKPREVRILKDEDTVSEISCGYYHTAIVTEEGRLHVFGNNDDRQLGRSMSDKFAGPQEVSLPNKVKAVACGNQHTIVLTDKGEVYACGHGDRGQLGLGSKLLSAESFENVESFRKRATAIAAGEGHTAVIGTRQDLYVFGDGKHGKLGSLTYSNEFEPCIIEKFKTYNVLKVVCGGCQTIVLAQKKSSDQKKSSGSEEDIGNTTLSVTQRPKSRARNERNNKTLTGRSLTVADSIDKSHLRIESDDDKSETGLSESLRSAKFNQTHTLTNGKFLPTQTPSLNRTSFRSNDDENKSLKTGALDRTVRLNKDPDDLTKTNNRFPPIDKSPIRNTRFDHTSPQPIKKNRNSDDDKSSSDERLKPLNKKPEQSAVPLRNDRRNSPLSRRKDESDSDDNQRKRSSPPLRNERKTSPLSRRKNDSDSDDNKRKRSSPPLRNNRRNSPLSRRKSESESDDDSKRKPPSPVKIPMSEKVTRKTRRQDDSEESEEDDSRRSRQKSPPPVARRSSLPPQTRAGAPIPSSRDGNQTIGSKPVDGVRGSFRSQANKSLAKPNQTDSNTDATKKEAPPAPQPGFFARLFGAKSTPPPPPPPPPPASTPATATNSRTCSIM